MKKIVIICLVGLFLPVVLLERSVFADVGGDLSQAEGLYKAGHYAQAEQPYLKVIHEADPNKPAESEAAVVAAKGLSLVYIATDRLPQAKEAIQPLVDRPTPHELHEIVEEAKTLQKLPQVHQLYQDMVAARPGDPQVIWLKTAMAIASVHLADDTAVEATLANIVANHKSDDRVVEAFGQIAWAYRKLEQYDKALRINQYTVDNWPQKDRVAYAQQGILLCQLELGDFEAADKALDVLVQRFSKDADASELVLWSAFGYDDAGEKEKAYKIYELVVQNYPDTPEAVTAQLRLAVAGVEAEDPSRMEQTIPPLLMQFEPTEDKAASLRYLADALGWKRLAYTEGAARQQDILALIDGYLLAVANYTVATWPESDWAARAQGDQATVAIDRGDDSAAQATIASLKGKHSDDPALAQALYEVGNTYNNAGHYDRAAELYQQVIASRPATKYAVLSKTGLGLIQLRRGQDNAAEALFQKIMADHADDAGLADAVRVMGESYYDQALAIEKGLSQERKADSNQPKARGPVPERVSQCFQRAIAKFDALREKWPNDAANAPFAYHFAGECYNRLGQREKAIECYQKVCDTWPEYQYAWHLQYLVGRAYENLSQSNPADSAQITPQVIAAYERVVKAYPNCPAARAAASRLQRYATLREGEQK